MDLSMTQRYMHLSPAALDAAIRLLEEPPGPVGVKTSRVRLKGDTTHALTNSWRHCGDGHQGGKTIKPGTKLAVRQGFVPSRKPPCKACAMPEAVPNRQRSVRRWR